MVKLLSVKVFFLRAHYFQQQFLLFVYEYMKAIMKGTYLFIYPLMCY